MLFGTVKVNEVWGQQGLSAQLGQWASGTLELTSPSRPLPMGSVYTTIYVLTQPLVKCFQRQGRHSEVHTNFTVCGHAHTLFSVELSVVYDHSALSLPYLV